MSFCRIIAEISGGEWEKKESAWNPEIFAYNISLACNHCAKPICLTSCPADAISKRKDGIVIIDKSQCIGCRNCEQECPYAAPQSGPEPDTKMKKCDLCSERWTEGKKPICVSGCPMRALDAGPIDELRAKYGDVRDTESFVYSEDLVPSITFKPKKDAKGLVVQRIEIAPSPRTNS